MKNHLHEKLFNLYVHVYINQTHSHITSFARGLVLKQRRKRQLFQVPVVFGAYENFDAGTVGTEISRESCQKIWNLSEFPKSEPFNGKFRKFREESQNGREIQVYLARLSPFPEIPENAVPFVSGNFQKFG